MKKIFIAIIIVLFTWSHSFAAGSSATVSTVPTDDMLATKVVTITYVGDDTNGTVPSATIPTTYIRNYSLLKIEMIPGTPAPDEYGVTVLNQYGFDLLGGTAATAGHATNKTQAACLLDGTSYREAPFDGNSLTVVIANQATANAKWIVNLYFIK